MTSFELGTVIVTQSIDTDMEKDLDFTAEVINALDKYGKADFSDMVYDQDIDENLRAIAMGDARIFATYNTTKGKIYIITEYDRSITTILYPWEY